MESHNVCVCVCVCVCVFVWLLSLSKMALRFIHVVFVHQVIPLYC